MSPGGGGRRACGDGLPLYGCGRRPAPITPLRAVAPGIGARSNTERVAG